jgi:hypothetical protein
MYDDIMSAHPQLYDNARFVSRITLAAMSDTGWYRTDLNNGLHVVMGRGSG